MNGLLVEKIPPELQLHDIENQMVARNLLFLKLKKLPNTPRMEAMTDRVINVPLTDDKILETVTVLPRTLDDSFLAPIKFKKKKEWKANYAEAFVRPSKLIKSLHKLKELGNPHYKSIIINEDFDDKNKDINPDFWNALTNRNPNENENQSSSDQVDESKDDQSSGDESSADEAEVDTRRKYQTAIGGVTCMIPKYPELDVVVNTSKIAKEVPLLDCEDSSGTFVLAPGQGMKATNIMRDRDWDAKAWPSLHPSGKFNLHHDRGDEKITPKKYGLQRLYNKDTRFSNNSSWIFAFQQFNERNDVENQIDLSFQKGKIQATGSSSVKVLQDHDAFSIFKKVQGTPKFWQAAKNDLLAKIQQLGPFHCFFTLSSAERRWPEVVTAVLEKDGHAITELCSLWRITDKGKLINKNGSWKFVDKLWNRKDENNKEDGFYLKLKDAPDTVLGLVEGKVTSEMKVTLQPENNSSSAKQHWHWEQSDDNEEEDGWSLLRNVETGYFLTASSTGNLTAEGKTFYKIPSNLFIYISLFIYF